MAYTQQNRFIALETPLGKDELILTAFRGTEGMSRLFSFELVGSSHNQGIAFENVLGKSVTISVVLADNKTKRYFNGIVSRFTQTGAGSRQDKEVHFAEYRAVMVPWLWFLTLTENSKIFQDKSVPDIVEDVFKGRGFKEYALRLHGTYDKRGYCVQYRESDFQFVSRLLEDEGIHYFFEHEDGKHTLVLADDPAENKPCPRQKTARFVGTAGAWSDEDRIQEFQKRMEVMPTKITLNDYNFEVPAGNLKVDAPISKKLTDRDCEIYDYPGGFEKRPAGDRLVNIRMQEEEARVSVFTGISDCRAFSSGQKFELKDYQRADMTNKQYVLTQIAHEAMQKFAASGGGEGEASYRNQFSCIPADVRFRPLRETPRTVVRGTQTAIVVGPSGEEIYTDEHGRIKVQFHWDRIGKKDDKSSCWIRVAQVWSGPGWGGVFIPRIGQEVVVDFLEGDPDRPIVIGAVYHGTNKPPYSLPDQKTKSTLKSETTIGGGGFNELRFEDKKGSEEIFLHGQKDWTIAILNDKTMTVGHDETAKIDNDRKETVDGNETVRIGKNRTNEVGGDEKIEITGNRTRSVGGNETVDVGKKRTKDIGSDETIKVGSNRTASVGKDETLDVAAERGVTVGKNDSLSVGKKLLIEAGDQIVLQTGSASITLKKDGKILIDGKDISIQGSGSINVKASGDVKIKGSKVLTN